MPWAVGESVDPNKSLQFDWACATNHYESYSDATFSLYREMLTRLGATNVAPISADR